MPLLLFCLPPHLSASKGEGQETDLETRRRHGSPEEPPSRDSQHGYSVAALQPDSLPPVLHSASGRKKKKTQEKDSVNNVKAGKTVGDAAVWRYIKKVRVVGSCV